MRFASAICVASSLLVALLLGSLAVQGQSLGPTDKGLVRAANKVAPPVVDTSKVQALTAQIEGFGFDTCTRFGYGGMVMVSACPVVLFRNGDALTQVKGLADPRGIAAHKAAKPKQWTAWRRSAGHVQLRKKDSWKNLGYAKVYRALPAGFRLDGRWRALRGSGTVANGGGQSAVAWTDYLFYPDGRVMRGSGAGASSAGDTSVTTRSLGAGRAGRYRIDGLVLVITYDNATTERRLLIADPEAHGKGAIWLDGEAYARRK